MSQVLDLAVHGGGHGPVEGHVDRIDLEQSQLAHHIKQPGRPRAIQELRAHGQAACVAAGEFADGHDLRLWDGPTGSHLPIGARR